MALSTVFSHPFLAGLGLLVGLLLYLVLRSRNAALEHLPGPFLAKYTDMWRGYKAWRYHGMDWNYGIEILRDYGEVVRVGPKTVAVFDPEAIPHIFGIRARLDKVRSSPLLV
jgi:hypothetical protein